MIIEGLFKVGRVRIIINLSDKFSVNKIFGGQNFSAEMIKSETRDFMALFREFMGFFLDLLGFLSEKVYRIFSK